MARNILQPGDAAPWFRAKASNNPNFDFATAAGRYMILSFFGSMDNPASAAAIHYLTSELRPLLNDDRIAFFGISIDEKDEQGRVHEIIPGIRYFWDTDHAVSKLYGALGGKKNAEGKNIYEPFTLVLDPMMRVLVNIPIDGEHNASLKAFLDDLPAQMPSSAAPVLILPRVFEPEFCRELIALYETHGGEASGFMREVNGQTIALHDSKIKRRKDFAFEEGEQYQPLRNEIMVRLKRRLLPEIEKAFQFKATRIERYIVSCYESEERGYFRAHRDNTTKGTAHRRFACTINLNAEDYEGGNLRFPEFGSLTYRAPTGGAAVFSCSLLHEATPVTSGKRYAFLPFFYDEASAKIRQENLQFVAEENRKRPTTDTQN